MTEQVLRIVYYCIIILHGKFEDCTNSIQINGLHAHQMVDCNTSVYGTNNIACTFLLNILGLD